MARIRTIKPSFFRSVPMSDLPIATRITFIGLWTYVDDEGRGVDDARLVKAELWPLDKNYTVKKVENDLNLLYAKGLIRRYSVGTRDYLVVVNWHEHQRINRPQESSLPAPEEGNDRSVNVHGMISESSLLEGKGRERKGKDILSALTEADDTSPPNPEVVALCENLADRVAGFFGDPRKRPSVTGRWLTDMRLLLDRGPLGRERPEAITPEQVSDFLEILFTKMATPEGKRGFCWAAQVRSPHGIREHWDQIVSAEQRGQQAPKPTTSGDYWVGPSGNRIYR